MSEATVPDTSSLTSSATASAEHQIDQWVNQLSERDMPVFAHTARVIAGEANKGDNSASQLAEQILQDPSMTVRLLRMANSIYYNPRANAINTVSRAIVVLGFKTVRSLCMSIAIVDSMLEGPCKQHAHGELARCFHAAMQARSLAVARKDKSPEEVFIATLLFHLGRLAFWCFGERVEKGVSVKLHEALCQPGAESQQMEREILGFELNQLSQALNREWNLSDLLDHALAGKQADNPRVSNVTLAHQLASHTERGWDDPQVTATLERIAESLYLPLDRVKRMAHDNAKEASQVMRNLGAGAAGKLIPVPVEKRSYGQNGDTADKTPKQKFLDPDPDLQLDILRDLSQLMIEKPDVGTLFELVLEGIFRGVGMDRVLLALLNPNHTQLKAKQTLGWDRQQLAQLFHFPISDPAEHIFDHVISEGLPLWLNETPSGQLNTLLTPRVNHVTGGCDCFVAPVVTKGRTIGLIYADRAPSRRSLDKASFNGFKLFGQQANLCLSYLKNGR